MATASHEGLDIVPDPERENLVRLAAQLRELGAERVGVGELAAQESPYDPTDPEQLAQGANFRLETRLGPLDIMQWVAGIQDDPAYPALAPRGDHRAVSWRAIARVWPEPSSRMKLAAGREEDLRDLREIGA